jgi:YVTN family beta-propeller protein
MRRSAGAFVLVAVLAAAACLSGPDGPDLTPSVLTLTFTGDSSRFRGDRDRTEIRPVSDGTRASCTVTAAWTSCPDVDFHSYTLYRSGEPGIPANPASADTSWVLYGTDTTMVDTGLSWATTYWYAVRTADEDGDGVWSDEASILTPGTAPTPSVISLEYSSWNLAVVGWTPCGDYDFASYHVYRSESPGIEEDPSSAELLFMTKTEDDFPDTAVEPMGHYYYALRTFSTKGLSSWSNEMEVTLPGSGLDTVIATLPVGSSPHGICALPSGDYVYAACGGSDDVRVIRTSDNTVVGQVDVGDNPYGICALPSGEYVYAACFGSSEVSVIRTSDNTLLTTIEVGGQPQDLCATPDGEYVYVTCDGPNQVWVIRTDLNTVSDSIDVSPGPMGICVLPTGDYVFVNCFFEYVDVIRTSDNEVVGWAGGVDGMPARGICALPSGSHVYSACWSENMLFEIETADYIVEGETPTGSVPNQVCCLPGGQYLALACGGADIVQIVRTCDGAVVGEPDAGDYPWGICSLPDVERVYVTNSGDGTVTVIE